MEIQGQIWTKDGQRGKALGIVFRNIKLHEMIKKLLNLDVVPTLWFSNLVVSKWISIQDFISLRMILKMG